MNLSSGTRLGPYEVLSPVGAGGMGEVYEGRDTRLGRRVALKIMKAPFAEEPALRERFEREARTISALSHPHICTLHDVGRHEGIHYLVMEYVEGETLAQRLGRGVLPLEEAVQRGAEIASALAAAHRRGIVHRDLKPANVILTKTGAKLLDFGLAKYVAGADDALEATALTQPHVFVGTLHYSSPEQMRGESLDARTDIFSLGVILYEMLAGTRPFEAGSRQSVMHALVEQPPRPIREIQPGVPAAVEHVVMRCLEKDREDRWQTAHDVRRELEWSCELERIARPPRRRGLARAAALAAAGVGIAALIATGAALASRPASDPPPVHFQIAPPPGLQWPSTASLAVSPDGRQLVYWSPEPDAEGQLWIRALDELSPRPLRGTAAGSYPFWSPTGNSIAFFTAGKLQRIDLRTESVRTVWSDGSDAVGQGGTWSRDDVIVFARSSKHPLYRVHASGGTAAPLTQLDTRAGETGHAWPSFLPDGTRVLYRAVGSGEGSNGIFLASLNEPGRPRRISDDHAALLAPPDHLLLVRQGELVAQRFDARAGELVGDAVPLATDVSFTKTGLLAASASAAGVLAYRPAESRGQVSWFDRSGKALGSVGPRGNFGGVALAPDQQRVAMVWFRPENDNHCDIWVADRARGTFSRVTAHPSNNLLPVWSPNGQEIAFTSDRSGALKPYRTGSAGAGGDGLLFPDSDGVIVTDWSRDGLWLLGQTRSPETRRDVWLFSRDPEVPGRPILATRFDESQARFSADGKWIAYTSDESGTSQVYIQSLPPDAAKWQISIDGGVLPRWRGDGGELFFLSPDGTLMSVPIRSAGGEVRPDSPVALFRPKLPGPAHAAAFYDASADGTEFVFNHAVETNSSAIAVLLHWQGKLPAGSNGPKRRLSGIRRSP